MTSKEKTVSGIRVVSPEKCKIMIGDKFENWTALGIPFYCRYSVYKESELMVVCGCTCGKIAVVTQYALLIGRSNSCIRCAVKNNGSTHGESHTRLYKIWMAMKGRCYIKSDTGFDRYGEAGIEVCDEWRENFLVFKDWALSHGYSENLTIDRKEPDKDYCPENCRWATVSQQGANTRKYKHSVMSKYKGVTFSKGKWIAQITVDYRHYNLGRFVSEIHAAMAYDREALKHFGEFARLNFPNLKLVAKRGVS